MRNALLTAWEWIEAIAVNLIGIAVAIGIIAIIGMVFSALRSTHNNTTQGKI